MIACGTSHGHHRVGIDAPGCCTPLLPPVACCRLPPGHPCTRYPSLCCLPCPQVTCWPAAAATARCASGSASPAAPAASAGCAPRCSRTPTRAPCARRAGRPAGATWPPPASTAPRRCGSTAAGHGRTWRCWRGTRARSSTWPGIPMAASSRLAAATRRCGSGRRSPATSTRWWTSSTGTRRHVRRACGAAVRTR